MHPDSALQHIARLIADTQPGPVADWFADGVGAFLDGQADLETALQLRGPGPLGNRAARKRIGNRNGTLRKCLGLFTGSEWQRCVALAERINKLDRIRDPGEVERLLLIARTYGELPTTPEGILRAVR